MGERLVLPNHSKYVDRKLDVSSCGRFILDSSTSWQHFCVFHCDKLVIRISTKRIPGVFQFVSLHLEHTPVGSVGFALGVDCCGPQERTLHDLSSLVSFSSSAVKSDVVYFTGP